MLPSYDGVLQIWEIRLQIILFVLSSSQKLFILHFLFKNPSLYPTHQLIHTLYLGYSSNLQQKSVCMPVSGLIPLMSTSSFILFSTTLSCGLLDSKETKTSKCSALLLRGWWLGDNWRLQIWDLTFILLSPTPHSKEQLSFQWFFKQETLQKRLPRTNRPEWYGHRDAIF